MSSSDKEQQILERQRLLACQLSKKNPSSTAASISIKSSSTKKSVIFPKPPPPKPSANTNSKYGPKETIDLTGDDFPLKKQSVSTGTTIKRPTLKRPSSSTRPVGVSASSSTAKIIAAARAKVASDNPLSSAMSSKSLKRNGDAPTFATEKSLKRSPKVQRKIPISAKAASSLTLASLVQHVASTDGSVAEDVLSSTSLPTYQPDDFWKNIRDWDLPSQYYYETQLQQIQQENHTRAHMDSDEWTDTPHRSNTPERKPIPDTFLNARHYIAAWAPLCMAECRSQLLQEFAQNCTNPLLVKVESTSTYIRKPRGGSAVDISQCDAVSWMEDNETSGYVKISCPPESKGGAAGMSFFPNDIVLLLQKQYKDVLRNIGNGTAQPPRVNGDPESLSKLSFAGISLVGHADTARRELDGLILKVSSRKWTKIGTKDMYLMKIGSNVTALREFTALCNVDTLPMKSFLFGHHLQKMEHRRKISRNQPIDQLLHQMGGEKLGDGFLKYASSKFNQSQLTAIAASAHEYGEGGFTLIKGPPGTGKTTTLVAVLNSLHIRQFNKYYDEVRRIATKATGSREKALAMALGAKPRLLVCAPSNAAIDNIILKIMEDGFVDGQGRRYNPSMIRVGVGQSFQVRGISLANKVDAIFDEYADAQQLQASIAGYQTELTHIARDIANVRRRAHAIETSTAWPLSKDWEIRIDEDVFEQVGKAYFVNHIEQITTYEVPPPPEPGQTHFKSTSMPEYRAYVSRLVKLVESYFSTKMHLERCTIVKQSLDIGANQFDIRQTLESHVLNSVHMVMTTLGSSGNRTLETADRFEVVVVDEAAQSVEPGSLSALRLGSRHAVLFGDPQQLPATIFNVSGRNSKYDRSLFQRLEEAFHPVYMLNEQYRMHPKISHFPRHIFYGGALLDGPNVTQPDYGNPLRAILCRAVPTFSPLTILDLDSKEERGGTSLLNRSEAQLAVFLYDQLKVHSRGLSAATKVAVITPYAQQCRLLREIFAERLGPQYESLVEVNTVDAFQGREANIVIFSAVRAAGSNGIGFLSDVRRMNVALTRAKFFLFVIARCASVVVNPYWSDLIDHARESNSVIRVPLLDNGSMSFDAVSKWKIEESTVGNIASLPSSQKPPEDPRKQQQL